MAESGWRMEALFCEREKGSIPSQGRRALGRRHGAQGAELLTHKIAFNSTSLNVNTVAAMGRSCVTYHFTESCSPLGGKPCSLAN